MKRLKELLVLFIVLAVLMAGCGSSPKSADTGKNPGTTEEQSNGDNQAEDSTTGADEAAWTVNLYFPDNNMMYMEKEVRLLEMDDKKLTIDEKGKILLEELMKGPENKELSPTSVPPAAKLLSVEHQDGTMIVDFSGEFESGHVGGSAGILATFAPIVLTLTDLKEVDQVSFLIDGKVKGDFKGHESLDRPFKREIYEQYVSE